MQKKLYLFILLLLPFLLAACKSESYAKKRKAELAAWEAYKSDNGLQISNDSAYCFSQTAPWPDNLYYEISK